MKVLSAVCVLLGCYLGAGFVSGREVAFYFSQYGKASYAGCLFCGLALFFLCMLFFNLPSFKIGVFDGNKLSKGIGVLLAICVLIFNASMFAGTYALAISLRIQPIILVFVTVIITFFVVKNNISGISKINIFFIPILIIVLLMTINTNGDFVCDIGNFFGGVVSGIWYVFINIVSIGLLIFDIRNQYSKKQKFLICFIFSFVVFLILCKFNHSIISNGLIFETIPVIKLSGRNDILNVIMYIIIYIAMLTTLISNVYIFAKMLNKKIKNFNCFIIISIFLSSVLSLLGFENFVAYVYTFVGIVGVIMSVVLFNKKNNIITNKANSFRSSL